MAKQVQLNPNEVVYLEPVNTMYIQGAMNVKPARFTVTNQRIRIEITSMMWGAMFGLIGALLSSLSKGKSIELEPNNIKYIEQIKHGLTDQAILITMNDGVTHKFMVKPNFEKIREALSKFGVQVKPLHTTV